ncbi:MAG: hypothetical protein Rubg2KO_03650 [Rubricoccaceae bacterium]
MVRRLDVRQLVVPKRVGMLTVQIGQSRAFGVAMVEECVVQVKDDGDGGWGMGDGGWGMGDGGIASSKKFHFCAIRLNGLVSISLRLEVGVASWSASISYLLFPIS